MPCSWEPGSSANGLPGYLSARCCGRDAPASLPDSPGLAKSIPDLTEWDYGDYEGLLTADVHRTDPDWYLYRDGAPGGESPAQVAVRADRFIERVRPIDGDVAAFSSAQIIRMIAARWLGLAPLEARLFYTETASVGILGYEHDRIQPVVHLWDDVGTLEKASR
jgi:broad specificity phosphatase PhoE